MRDHYNVQVNGETMLDFEGLHKLSEETYRQFFERLLQHTRQHLAPADAKVEGIKMDSADKMTISLMNLVALQWLRKINPSLIDIIKTEYGKDLRNNVQLSSLVPQIAPNVESLLSRYENGAEVNKINRYDQDDNEVIVQKTVVNNQNN